MKLTGGLLPTLLAMGALAYAEEITIPGNRDMKAPFKGKLLETFLAGSPPPILTSRQYILGFTSSKCSVWHDGADGPTQQIRPGTMILPWTALSSVEDFNPVFSPAEGINILHDSKGRVSQAWSELVVADFKREPKKLTVKIWRILDTRYGGELPGARIPLAGKTPVWSWVITELAKDEAKGLLETLTVTTNERGLVDTGRTTLNHNAKRTLLVTEDYTGGEIHPDKMISRSSFQRVYWPEGPGIRQMIQEFEQDVSGNLVPVNDVDEYWNVDGQGNRTLASRKNKLGR